MGRPICETYAEVTERSPMEQPPPQLPQASPSSHLATVGTDAGGSNKHSGLDD